MSLTLPRSAGCDQAIRRVPARVIAFLFAVMLVAFTLGMMIGFALSGVDWTLKLGFNSANSVIDNF